MKLKECCYNCRRSEKWDCGTKVFCLKFQEIRDEDDCCDEFIPESFCADPYE